MKCHELHPRSLWTGLAVCRGEMPAWIYCCRSYLSITHQDIFRKEVSNHSITMTIKDWVLLPSTVPPYFSHNQLRDQEAICCFFSWISCPATLLQPHVQGTTTSVHHWSSRFLRQKLQDSMANKGKLWQTYERYPRWYKSCDVRSWLYNEFLWISCWRQPRESYPEQLLDKSLNTSART